MKDVVIPDSAPSSLLLQKHVDYIAAYGAKKDDYVSIIFVHVIIKNNSNDYKKGVTETSNKEK